MSRIVRDRYPIAQLPEDLRKMLPAVTSELTLAELTAPVKNLKAKSMSERRSLFRPIFQDGGLLIPQPITSDILDKTPELRADDSLRLADAIHVATALTSECRFFLSYDTDAARLPPSLASVTLTESDLDRLLAALSAATQSSD